MESINKRLASDTSMSIVDQTCTEYMGQPKTGPLVADTGVRAKDTPPEKSRDHQVPILVPVPLERRPLLGPSRYQ
jgi:hypothetical protein